MATLQIPTPPEGVFAWIVRVRLEGVFYRFQFVWNARSGAYFLDMGNDAGEATVRNMKLVIATDILEPHKSLGQATVPQGNLRVVDTSGQDLEANFGDLGERVLLLYDETG